MEILVARQQAWSHLSVPHAPRVVVANSLVTGGPSSCQQPTRVAPRQPRFCTSSLDCGLLQQPYKSLLGGRAPLRSVRFAL